VNINSEGKRKVFMITALSRCGRFDEVNLSSYSIQSNLKQFSEVLPEEDLFGN